MKKILTRSLAALLAFAAVLALPVSTAVFAEEGSDESEKPAVWLQVSPVSQRLNLNPGDHGEYEMTVENIGSGDFTFKVYASPYNVVGEQYDLNFTEETPRSQIVRWINFEQSEYALAAGEKQIVKYTIDVPEDVAGGGQYATIFAESSGRALDANTSGVQTVSRIGMILYARVSGETREEANITDFNIQTYYSSGNIGVTSKVENKGNTDFEAKYTLKISPLIGNPIYEPETKVHEVFPDSERRIDMAWENTPAFGIFRVTHSVTVPGETRSETRVVFVIPPFVIIIALVLLTFIAIWIIILVKRRRVAKAKSRI